MSLILEERADSSVDSVPDLRLSSSFALTHDSDASRHFKKPYFSNKESSVTLTRAAVAQNSHLSFRFTTPFAVPNLIWSSLKFIKVLYCGGGLRLKPSLSGPRRRPSLRVMDLPAVYKWLSGHLVRTKRALKGLKGKHQILFWFCGPLRPPEIPFRLTFPRLLAPSPHFYSVSERFSDCVYILCC